MVKNFLLLPRLCRNALERCTDSSSSSAASVLGSTVSAIKALWCLYRSNNQNKYYVQMGFIESIVKDRGLNTNSNSKTTPSDSILHPDTNGLPRQETWNYHSDIGMLNFFAQSTWPNLNFAVHQCARFCNNPTALHELTFKCIASKGLILHPTKDFNLDMYVHADFTSMWHQQHPALRDNSLSQTGYIITFCGFPFTLGWQIAISTTESK
jgi:hypothetical protein